MSPRSRFSVWTLCVVGSLFVATVWIVAVNQMPAHGTVLWLGGSLFALLTAGMTALIVTTPPDAVRLPANQSTAYITLGTAWLAVVAASQHFTRPDATPTTAPGLILMTLAVGAVSIAFRSVGRTPWWAAVLAWNPLAIGPLAASPLVVAGTLSILALVIGLFGQLRRVD